MLRLFVALPLPEDIRDRLAFLQGGVPDARWVPRENFHVTLQFIGDAPEDRAEDVDAALAGVRAPAFDLRLDGVGMFGEGHRARTLWAGVEKNEALIHLQARVAAALERIGMRGEARKYQPHVTLARSGGRSPNGRVQAFLEDRQGFRTQPFPAREFALYRSRLGGGAPAYEILETYPLRGDGP